MKVILTLIIFLALIWVPVTYKVYGWKEVLILTVSLGIASWLIDKFILDRRRRKSQRNISGL
jgi:hypothetical protein